MRIYEQTTKLYLLATLCQYLHAINFPSSDNVENNNNNSNKSYNTESNEP